ncbi:MAG TPA: CoA transferase [Candidatus Limnocylindria bacterium]|nr:CoA transferase [Candidatus Limnocylindria bacterium]
MTRDLRTRHHARAAMLQGIRVLDLSRVIAGPYCAALLGDLGADVIKLERPGRGDDLRALRGTGQMSAPFAAVNRNKRGIAVDLQKPEGARLAFDLARRADVVIENFLPGVAEKLGLGYAAVRAVNPAVVYASVTGFGQTGPLARKPGYNTIAQGMSGLMALTGMPGDPPTRVGGSVSDVAASYMTFGMVNAALVHRFRTGDGQHVDVSLVSASLGLLPDPVAIYFDTGERPKRAGNRNLHLSPAEAFQAKDGFVNVVLMNPEQWGRFCQALGDPAMEADPRFADNPARLANHAAFKARVEAVLGTASATDWVARFEAGGIAAGPIYEFHEVFEDPQVRHLGLVAEVDQPGAGKVKILTFPGRASATPPRIDRPAPLLGQHTAEVLGELGLSREEIDRLAAASVIVLGDQPA